VHTSTESPARRYRGSPLARRIGSAALAVIILTYLLLISVSRFGDLHVPRDYVVLGSLWLLGLIALGLLARAWRASAQKGSH
jgi:hypothetical protein